ncbi:hypothetical protein ACCS93_29915 [Rhizobium ruizarguesonis]
MASGTVQLVRRATDLVSASTTLDDILQRDNTVFRDAMHLFNGNLEPADANDGAVRAYRLMEDIKRIMENVERDMAGHDHVPEGLTRFLAGTVKSSFKSTRDPTRYLRRQGLVVTKLLGAFEGSTSAFVRSAWTATVAVTLGWQTAIAVKGPDGSFIPLRMSTIQRSTFIFLDWIWNPVGNVDRIFDMFMQRAIVPGFTQLLYTFVCFERFRAFYDTDGYKGINNSLGPAFTVGLVLSQWARKWHDNTDITIAVSALHPADDAGVEVGLAGLPERLRPRYEEARSTIARIKVLKERYSLSHGEEDTYNAMLEEWNRYVMCLGAMVNGAPQAEDDVDREEKEGVLFLTVMVSALQTAFTAKNPVSFATQLQQSIYFIERVRASTYTETHRLKKTSHIFSQAGAILIPMFPAIFIPLLINKDTFDDPKWVYGSTISLGLIAASVVHKLAPISLPYLLPLLRGLGWIIRAIRRKRAVPQAMPMGAVAAREAPLSLFFPDGDEEPPLGKWEELTSGDDDEVPPQAGEGEDLLDFASLFLEAFGVESDEVGGDNIIAAMLAEVGAIEDDHHTAAEGSGTLEDEGKLEGLSLAMRKLAFDGRSGTTSAGGNPFVELASLSDINDETAELRSLDTIMSMVSSIFESTNGRAFLRGLPLVF